MPSPQIASAYAVQPAYAAARAARPYAIPGAAMRGAPAPRPGRPMLVPATFFFAGLAAGAVVAVAIARAVLR